MRRKKTLEEQNAYNRQNYHQMSPERKTERVREIKDSQKRRSIKNKLRLIKEMGGVCSKCKKAYHPAAMQFHHVGKKTKNISLMLSQGAAWKKLKKEADQCILLCANCHHILHYAKKYDASIA